MDRVNFLTIETGKDLILSFSFDDEGTKYGVDGFTIHRAPQYESIVEPHKRGPVVDWTDEDRIILLREVEFDRNSIRIVHDDGTESFDISHIDEDEYSDMLKVLEKINFDNAFRAVNKGKTRQ